MDAVLRDEQRCSSDVLAVVLGVRLVFVLGRSRRPADICVEQQDPEDQDRDHDK